MIHRAAVSLLLLAGCARRAAAPGVDVTHGVASGDVTATSAVVWARAARPARVVVAISPREDLGDARYLVGPPLTPETDLAASVRVDGLEPDTRYHYRVGLHAEGSTDEVTLTSAPGSFRTAPRPGARRPVRFVWSGDLGGQGYCRLAARGGYPIFDAMAALEPDFFVANGDLVYADGVCAAGRGNVPGDFPGVGDPAVDWRDAARLREIVFAHWRYNRADGAFQRFLARTPVYAQWDDHEVINDFGGGWSYWSLDVRDRPGYPNLVAAGRAAFFAWSPVDAAVRGPDRVYGSFAWGDTLELFLVDARSYRSRNDLHDTPEAQKTLLGAPQRAWLVERLAASRAVWKIVSADVPLSVPTGYQADRLGRDGWASGDAGPAARTGFERELLDILRALDARKVQNLVFITTDVHFAQVARYAVDLDGDGRRLGFHELIAGPLSAYTAQPVPPDSTLAPEVLYAEGDFLNFGHVQIDESMRLRADIRDQAGAVRPRSAVTLSPMSP